MLQAQLIITGDLAEVTTLASTLSGAGVKVETPVFTPAPTDDEPVKAPKQTKTKTAKPASAVDEPETPEEPAEDFKAEETKAPNMNGQKVTLEHLMSRIEKVGSKTNDHKARLATALGKYKDSSGKNVLHLQTLETSDYESFGNDIEMINVELYIRSAISSDNDLKKATGAMLGKYFTGYTLSSIPSERYPELKSRFEELV